MKSMITSSMMVVVTTIVIHSFQISYTDASMTSGITQFWNRITSFTSGTTSSIIAVNSNLDPVVKPVQEESFECPVVEDDIFCEQLWEPVECNKLCNYTNACEAGGAGFLVDTDCVDIVVEEEGGGGSINNDCPTLLDDIFCETSWEPVLCNNGACRYSNACEASGSGFIVDTDCVPEIV